MIDDARHEQLLIAGSRRNELLCHLQDAAQSVDFKLFLSGVVSTDPMALDFCLKSLENPSDQSEPISAQGKRVIDLGHGIGVSSIVFALHGAMVFGIDNNHEALKSANSLLQVLSSDQTFFLRQPRFVYGKFSPKGIVVDQHTENFNLEEFDVWYSYPLEENIRTVMHLFETYAKRGAVLIMNGFTNGLEDYLRFQQSSFTRRIKHQDGTFYIFQKNGG